MKTKAALPVPSVVDDSPVVVGVSVVVGSSVVVGWSVIKKNIQCMFKMCFINTGYMTCWMIVCQTR